MPKLFTRAEAEEFFARLKKLDPEPKTELQYVNPYTLLVAVVMSAQATDKGVNKATARLFKDANTPQAMLDEAAALIKYAAANPNETYMKTWFGARNIPTSRAAVDTGMR